MPGKRTGHGKPQYRSTTLDKGIALQFCKQDDSSGLGGGTICLLEHCERFKTRLSGRFSCDRTSILANFGERSEKQFQRRAKI